MSSPNSNLFKAFPAAVRDEALKLISAFPEPTLNADSFSVKIGDELVWIPYRIYHDPASIDSTSLSQMQRELLACLLTRHHDGFIRHANMIKVLDCDREWVPPFIIQLVGEYVIEIVHSIRDRVNCLNPDLYKAFLMANPAFYGITKARVMSYWNCYHREQRREDYAGFQVLGFFDRLLSKSHL
jgi:hypothetical protein